MVKLPKLVLPVILAGLFLLCTSLDDLNDKGGANINSLINLNKGMQAFGFRTQEQWRTLSKQWIQPYYPQPFTPGLYGYYPYMIYPYWQGDLYKEYHFDHIKRLGYLGYMLDPNTGRPALTYSWTVNNITETAKMFDIPVDLVLYCTGKYETDVFLSSQSARDTCIKQIISYVTERRSRFKSVDPYVDSLFNADGINIFFPDFSFEKRREFGLFINDLFWKYRYGNNSRKLILTFPLRDAINYQYIEGLKKYVDEVYFADYDYRGIIRDTTQTLYYWRNFQKQDDSLSLLKGMINEIRLAQLYNPLKTKEQDNSSIEEEWMKYLFAIGAIFLIFLIATLLTLFWARFNQFVTENRSIVFLVGALLLIEAFFLFIFMVEKMNYDTWLINTDNPGAKLFLSIPLLLIVVFPVIKLLQGQKHLP
ncbi:MAG TPA: hypothetical protein PKH79_09015 [Prolixibacteraceae bacterium]|nr:hypothetical protein [Prolixibacteraceae bacterium]